MEQSSSFQSQRGKSYGVEHLLAQRSGPLAEILQESLDLPENQIEFLLNFGAVYVDESRFAGPQDTAVAKGAYLRVHQRPRRFPVEIFQPEKTIVYEDEDILVVNKPSGLPVHPTVDNAKENLQSLLSSVLGFKLLVTHRLDVATSGLLIYAKSKESQAEINRQLAFGEIKKIYRAEVHGSNTPLGELTHYMQPSPRAPKVLSLVEKPGWAQCRLRILDENQICENHSRLLIELVTGRTHQIRAQLAFVGHPIKGDGAYGSTIKLAEYEKIALQAFFLSFSWKDQVRKFVLPQDFTEPNPFCF